jgi:hypothetical protein
MNFRTNTKKSAPLIEIVETPVTKTQPRLVRTIEKNTRNATEDTSVIDLSTNDLSTNPVQVVVYIRPFEDEEKLKELLNEGIDKISYLFRGITSIHLKNLFVNAANKTALRDSKEIKIDENIFQFNYEVFRREHVYGFVNSFYSDYIK